jgi:hypothetical protein
MTFYVKAARLTPTALLAQSKLLQPRTGKQIHGFVLDRNDNLGLRTVRQM